MDEYAAAGPFDFTVSEGEWFDARRGRLLPFRRYQPLNHEAAPWIVYSHGLGGSRGSGRDWLAHWASWGIASFALQHPGTDEQAMASSSPLSLRRLLRTAMDAEQLAARADDLRFALDRTEAESPGTAIGIAGHSFGAVSALRLIGERRGINDFAADPRLRAALLLSPSARQTGVPLTDRFNDITLPCISLTGTRDDGIGHGDIDAANRCLPFEHMPAPDKYLIVLAGADHQTFAGQADRGQTARPLPQHTACLRAGATAFLLTYLGADSLARSRLTAAFDHAPDGAHRYARK